MKKIIIITLFALVLLSGCSEASRYSEEEMGVITQCVIDTARCNDVHNWKNEGAPTYKKVCECVSKDQNKLTLDLGCTEDYPYCSLEFEHKFELAKISHNWYCVCNEIRQEYYCDLSEEELCNGMYTELKSHRVNRTTDFTFNY